MDFLESLNLSTLPEQQTRIDSKVSKVLESNPDIRLGFDACATCGTTITHQKKIVCKLCNRICYCSKDCRRQDSSTLSGDDEDHALGHSATVCNVLRLCHVDEEIELLMHRKSSIRSGGGSKHITTEERGASEQRISSEYESYPATLANIIIDAPCFKPILDKFASSSKHNFESKQQGEADHVLTIHIIGASTEAELWGDYNAKDFTGCEDVYDGYLSAFTELASTLQHLHTIHLVFVGPNCSSAYVERAFDDGDDLAEGDMGKDWAKNEKKRKLQDMKQDRCRLIIECHDSAYDRNFLESGSSRLNNTDSKKIKVSTEAGSTLTAVRPDIVVFFNPGFTCPDYSWEEALESCAAFTATPFFITTNTEMEALADLQFLHQKKYILSMPRSVSDIVSDGIGDHDIDSIEYGDVMFFGENPNAGMRVRQSGNMANDLFVKNRWVFGGVFGERNEKNSAQNKKDKPSSARRNKKKKNSSLM